MARLCSALMPPLLFDACAVQPGHGTGLHLTPARHAAVSGCVVWPLCGSFCLLAVWRCWVGSEGGWVGLSCGFGSPTGTFALPSHWRNFQFSPASEFSESLVCTEVADPVRVALAV